MNGRSKWLAVILLLVAGLMLVACGGGVTETPAAPVDEVTEEPVVEETEEPVVEETEEPAEEVTEEATEEAAEEETEEAAEEETTPEAVVRDPEADLVVWADETRAPVLQGVADAFEEEFGVIVAVQQVDSGEIRNQVGIAGPAGEGPDIYVGAHDWLGELVANGTVAEMDLTGIEDQFEPSALEAFTYNGILYGMPYATENIAFFCNPEIVDTMPTTWDEVRALADELSAEGISAWTIETNDPYHWFPQMTAFGGYIFGTTEEGYDATDVGLDSPGAIAAAEWLGEMVDAGYLEPGMDRNTRLALYNNGELACFNGGPWDLPDVRDAGTPYVVGPFPTGTEGPGEPFLGVQGFMISPFSEDPLLAQAFLTEFVATEDVMYQLYEAGGRPPAFIPALERVEDEDLQAFAEVGGDARPMPAIPEMSAVWSAWGGAQELIIGGDLEPEEAMTDAAQQVRDAIGVTEQ